MQNKTESRISLVSKSLPIKLQSFVSFLFSIGKKKQYVLSNVLGTKIEIDLSGKLTGNFSSKNCYGQEKVNRLLEKEPDRTNYILYAYGDSAGDKEIIEFADYGYYIK